MSTPAPGSSTSGSPSSGGSFHERHRRDHDSSAGKWIAWAVFAHVVIILLLVFTPLGHYLFSADTTPRQRKNISANQVEELAEQLKEANRKELREQIKELEELLKELEELEKQRETEYVSNAGDEPLEAPDDALSRMLLAYEQMVGSAQATAQYSADFAEPVGGVSPFAQLIDPAMPLDNWIAKTELVQGQIAEHQRQALYLLAAVPFDTATVRAQQEAAIEAQRRADASHGDARSLHEKLRAVPEQQKRLESVTAQRDSLKDRVDKLIVRIAEAEARLPGHQEELSKVQNVMANLKDEEQAVRNSGDTKRLDQWKRRVDGIQKSIEANQRRIDNEHKVIARDQDTLSKLQPQLDDRDIQVQQIAADLKAATDTLDRTLTALGGKTAAIEGVGLTLTRDELQVATDQKAAIDLLLKLMEEQEQLQQEMQEQVTKDIEQTVEETLADAKQLVTELQQVQQQTQTLEQQTTDAQTKEQLQQQQEQVEQAITQTQEVVETLAEVDQKELSPEQLEELAEVLETVAEVVPKTQEITETVETVKQQTEQVAQDQQENEQAQELKTTAEKADATAEQMNEKLTKLQQMSERLEELMNPEVDTSAVAFAQHQQIDTTQMDLTELYETAKTVEDRITERYRDIQAMNLAEFADMTLNEAVDHTDLVQVDRDDIKQEVVEATARTEKQLAELKEELKTINTESQAMLSLSQMLLEEAQNVGMFDAGELALEAVPEKMGIGEGDGDSEENGEGGAGGSNAAQAEAGEGVDTAKLSAVGLAEGEVAFNYKELDSVHATQIARPGSPHTAAGWVAIDTWYFIGPYDNPGRRNLKRKFQPESAVDLDAVYTGKRGESIRWVFTQSTHPNGMVVPVNAITTAPDGTRQFESWAIWYGYAEINVDVPGEYWLAMGCDDFAKVWLNDEFIWASGEKHKSWQPNEYIEKYQLKAGTNRILFRLENGQHGCGMSVHIFIPEPGQTNDPGAA